jgi:O-antigen chain-terminating methyltransferase
VVQSAQAQAHQLAQQLEQTQAGEQQAKAQLQQALEVVQSAQAQAHQLAQQLEQTQAGEQQAKAQINILTLELRGAKDENQTNDQIINDQKIQLSQIQEELHRVHQSNHYFFLLSEQKQDQIEKIYDSTSWKVTKPIRVIKRIFSGLLKALKKIAKFPSIAVKNLIKIVLYKISTWIHKRPVLKYKCINFLNKFPSLKYKLKLIIAKSSHSQLLSNQISLPEEASHHKSDENFQKISSEKLVVSNDIDVILLVIKGKLDKGISS